MGRLSQMSISTRKRFRTVSAVCVGALVVIAVGCVGFVEVSGPHDAFSWWAEIFIPALVGAGTVLVSYAALEEARVLNRLVVETYVSLPGMRDQRSELKQAEIDARVALEQSIVPGAETLYGITVYDLKNRFMYIVIHDEESVLVKAWKRRIERRRHERTKGRIRAWALDPEAQVATLDAESRDIHDAPLDYLMFGEDPTPAA